MNHKAIILLVATLCVVGAHGDIVAIIKLIQTVFCGILGIC